MQKYLGALILIIVIAVAVGWQWQRQQRPSAITLTGRVGGEKVGFLNNPEVQTVLKDRYGISVSAQRYGSVEMVTTSPLGQQFLWPASEVNLEYYRERGGQIAQSQNLFHSPIVFYSWDIITDSLVQQGIVEKIGSSYYVVDFSRLIQLVEAKTPWADLGLPQLYGTIKIISTDPSKSNSGNSFAGLLANMFNAGEVVSTTNGETLTTILPRLQAFFTRMGFLEHSSGVLWDKFINQGAGAYPLIVGYENQLVEYSIQHPDVLELLRKKVRILYPKPTVWSSHPFIAVEADGQRLLDALKDPEIQQLAWTRHGFRSGLLGSQNDPDVLDVIGLPSMIDAVMPLPHATVMEHILQALSQNRSDHRLPSQSTSR